MTGLSPKRGFWHLERGGEGAHDDSRPSTKDHWRATFDRSSCPRHPLLRNAAQEPAPSEAVSAFSVTVSGKPCVVTAPHHASICCRGLEPGSVHTGESVQFQGSVQGGRVV